MARESPARAGDLLAGGDGAGTGLDLGLFSAGGPFAAFAGPALVVGRNAVVLAVNEPGQPLAELLQRGGNGELRTAIDTALAGRPAQVNPLVLGPAETGEPGERAIDVVALPWGEGAAALLLGRDVTLERSLRLALVDSRQRYKELVEVCGDFAWETDAEGRFAFVSPRGALGFDAAELVGRPADELVPEDTVAAAAVFRAEDPVDEVELWARRADGTAACLVATARPLTRETGREGARGVCRDVTEVREREALLERARHRERLLAYVLRIVREELEPTAMLSAAVEAIVPALGLTGAGVYRRNGDALVCAAAAGQLPPMAELAAAIGDREAGRNHKTASDSGALHAVTTCYRSQPNGALCLWREEAEAAFADDDRRLADDIAAQLGVALEQLSREEELARLTATDALTGLANRRGFLQALTRRMQEPGERRGPGALLYVDVDNFKLVNDNRGHKAGDEALEAIARLLRAEVREGDMAARLGGDEFALFVAPMGEDAAQRAAERLLAAAEPLAGLTDDPDRPLSLSIGVALTGDAPEGDPADLLERADRAMYRAKDAGKGGVVVASAETA